MAGPLFGLVAGVATILQSLAAAVWGVLTSVVGRKLLQALGLGSAAALATLAATQIVVAAVAAFLEAVGFGSWSQSAATLLVEGLPSTWPALVGFIQTIPGVATAIGGAIGAFFGIRR